MQSFSNARKGILFELRLPEIHNELTATSTSERGERLHEIGSVDELFDELNQ